MGHLIDRRLQGKNKSAINRDRFLKRYKSHIKEAVDKAVKGRSITEMEKGEKVTVPVRDMNEPSFGHGRGGVWDTVRPGNEEYITGDKFQRPRGGQGGSGKGKAGNSDETSEDEFTFELTKEEFMRYFFDDLELPNMVKTQITQSTEFKHQRAGYTTSGTSSNVDIVRSLRGALGRRIGVGGGKRKRLNEAKKELEELLEHKDESDALVIALREEIRLLRVKLDNVPFLDPIDLRYKNRIKVPKPSSRAVMFCIMDVSGSMSQERKDIAKRFFILLYLFLTRSYDKIEVVFIRHHTQAAEVTEEEFFHSRESGGTVVSSAINLLDDIIKQRYMGDNWNMYVAQASDGDNWDNDSSLCREVIQEQIMPVVQYYAYVEITRDRHQNMWEEYQKIADTTENFAMQKIAEVSDIYPVFRELFKKKDV